MSASVRTKPTAATPLDGAPAPKRYTRGTHRVVPPEATLERLRPLTERMGITRVANITGLDELGIPVAAAYRPNSRALSVSQGKGLDLAAAKASALMESIEGYHAERIDASVVLGTHDELRAIRSVVDADRLQAVAASPFHGGLPILWIEARRLSDGSGTLVPYELVHTNYTLPLPQGSGCFQASSNGLASGNDWFEALSHGICELVERDATAVWWARSTDARAATRLDLSTVDDGDCLAVAERFAANGVAVAAWEITSEIGIPAFYCVIAPQAKSAGDHLLVADGMGCHPSREVALLRALLEAAQSRLTVIAGVRDDLTWETYRSAASRAHAQRLRRLPETGRGGNAFRDGPDLAGATLDEDVRAELAALRAPGFDDVLVVDLSRPQLGIPVVRVVIPGLEGVCFQAGYVPGARARAAAVRAS